MWQPLKIQKCKMHMGYSQNTCNGKSEDTLQLDVSRNFHKEDGI